MKSVSSFFPILQWLPNYQRSYLRNDLFAGITVGIMLIPQGMAYALIAGLPPVYGLYASIIPQIIYAIFGTSRQLSVAPVAMDSLLVAAGVSVLATEGTDAYIGFAILLAFFMGAFQLLLGLLRMGFITNLLAKPVINGFTSAAALIIGLNQLKYLLGTDIEKSNNVYQIIWNAVKQLNETHLTTLGIGIAGIIIIKGAKRLHRNIPGALLVVILGTSCVYFLHLDQVGVSIVQTIPEGLPSFKLPQFNLGMMGELLPLALTISLVAFMEAFSVAKAIEAKKKTYKVIPNQELIGLGAANLVGSFFQAYPVTGGFSRSAVNEQAGAITPLSSIVSATLVSLTLVFLTPLFYYLPHAVLASVIMVAVIGLIDLNYPKSLWKDSKVEFVLLLVTFLVTLSFSMVPGIITGIVGSVLILLYRSAYPHIARLGKIKGHYEYRNITRFSNLETWDDLIILRIDSPLSFINIQGVKEYIEKAIDDHPNVKKLIIDAGPVSYLDATATNGFREIISFLKDKGVALILCDVIGPMRDVMYRTGLIDDIGKTNILLSLNEAVEFAASNVESAYRKEALQSNVSR